MTLADTSVWIDHFRQTNSRLTELLDTEQIIIHDLVIEELACGNLTDREKTIGFLSNLPRMASSTHTEVMGLIRLRKIYGTGIGSVDANLIASCLFAEAELFTLDKNLAQAWANCKA